MLRALVLILFLLLGFGPALAESSKVGVVDGEKLFDSYPQAQEATKKISDAQDDLRAIIAETESSYGEFEKQKKSEAEKLTKKKELQAKIDAKAQETRKMIELLSMKVEEDILQAIKDVSAEKGLDVVFDKKAVLAGGVDVTNEVTERLKKNVPLAGLQPQNQTETITKKESKENKKDGSKKQN